MFGLGWSEMMVVGIVALIVIGPKDLPQLFRKVGEFTGKARGMAREFSRAMNAAADESGIREVSNSLKAASNPTKFGVDKIKEATGITKSPETSGLSAERQEMKEKMSDAMAKAAEDRMAREVEEGVQKAAEEAAEKAAKGDA